MKKKLIFAISIAAISITSCKKNSSSPAAPPAHVTLDAEGLTYVQLPLNRYFIYKDSATGALDSVVVTQSSLQDVSAPPRAGTGLFDPGAPAYNYQTYTLTLSKYNGASAQDWFYAIASTATLFAVTANTVSPLFFLERDRANNADKNYVFNYPFNTTIWTTDTVAVLPSITIEGRTYSNAVMYLDFNGLLSTHPNYRKSTYYWVKGLGIIKREVRTTTSIKTDLLVRNG